MSVKVYSDPGIEVRIGDDFPPMDLEVFVHIQACGRSITKMLTLDAAQAMATAILERIAERRRDLRCEACETGRCRDAGGNPREGCLQLCTCGVCGPPRRAA